MSKENMQWNLHGLKNIDEKDTNTKEMIDNNKTQYSSSSSIRFQDKMINRLRNENGNKDTRVKERINNDNLP
mgnify:CR=1 FL=1